MKLDTEFYQLPLLFDSERLQREAQRFEGFEWRPDRFGVSGYWSLNLVAHRGGVNEERQYGPMAATVFLDRSPYLRQVIASFGSPCAEVRLRRLGGQAAVPPHIDTNYLWFRRFRLHVPITSSPDVAFVCNGKSVHMLPGEAWLFDRLQSHEVRNGSDGDRIHLIIDTVGSDTLFDLIRTSRRPLIETPKDFRPRFLEYDPASRACLDISTDITPISPILAPCDLDEFLSDLSGRLEGLEEADATRDRLSRFALEWRQLWALYGPARAHWFKYRQVAERVYRDVKTIESDAARQLIPPPALRFYAFLQTGAFNPRVAEERASAIDASTNVRVAAEISLRLDPNGVLSLFHRGECVEFEWTQLLFLSQLARNGVPAAAAASVGLNDEEGAREVIGEWLEEGILEPFWDDERPLDLEPSRPLDERRSVLRERDPAGSVSRAVNLSATTRLRIREAVHLRLTPSGQLWMWSPQHCTYRLTQGVEAAFLCCLSTGRAIGEAAADANLACDGALLAAVQELLELGVVSA
jgi:hypothetical protein